MTSPAANAAYPEAGVGDHGVPLVPGVQLLEELGRGAHTVVYRARRDDALYAVKMLAQPGDEVAATEFRREAALLACVEHPSLVRVHEVGETAGHPYLIMDLIDGRPLAAVLDDGRWDESATVALGSALAAALGQAHRTGLVHRDIKPQNIMISGAGQPYLIDFGLAARSGGRAGDMAVGTFGYSAPEQTGMLHRAVDGRADLYSLGVVLFECMVGAPPFAAENAAELARLHLSATPDSVTQRRPDTSPAFAAMIAKLLAKDPDDRYQSAEALRADLQRLAAGSLQATALSAGDGAGRDNDLVGRTTEHTTLRARWERARMSAGGVVLVQGATGAGKSRLVRELTADVSGTGDLVLRGRCVLDSTVPLAAMRSIVERHIADIDRMPPADRSAAVSRLRQVAGGTAAVLAVMSPALGAMLDAPELPDGDHERQLDEAVAALFVGLAQAAGGAVLHLDDVAWCDDRSRRVLRCLAPQLVGVPLLVVCTARDDADCHEQVESFAADAAEALDLRLTLKPLAEDATAALVASHLGSAAAPADLITRVTARSAGNPMAVLEYVRAVVDAGLLRPCWGQWQLDQAGLEALALPDNLLDLVLRRIDGLGPAGRDLLTVAAAIGTQFTGDLVAMVAEVTVDTVHDVLTEAAGHRLIEAAVGDGHRFLHDRIRETLLADLDAEALRMLHHRIAIELEQAGPQSLESEHAYEIARHYLLGDTGLDPKRVFAAVVAAGTLALHQHAPAEAVSLLTRAAELAETAGLATDADFHADLGLAATRLGNHGKALRHLHIALDAEHDPMRRAWLCARLADAHLLHHDAEPAVAIACQGFAEIGDPLPRNPFWLSLSTVWLVMWAVILSLLPARWRAARADRVPHYRLRQDLVTVSGEAATVGQRHALFATILLRSQPIAQRLRPAREYAENQVGLGFLIRVIGFKRRSARMIARAMAIAEPTGDLRLIARLHFYRVYANDAFPPLTADSGKDMCETLAAQGRWLDFRFYLTLVGMLEQTWLARGHTAEAAESHRRALARAPSENEVLGHVFGIAGVELAALSGRPADAARQLAAIRDLLDTRPVDPVIHTKAAIAAIRLAVEQGELGAAFDDACAAFDALGLKPARVFTLDRMCWVYRAYGRLAQAAALPSDQRGERLAAAATAIAELRRAVNGPVLRVYHDVARCALAQLRGQHRVALQRLAMLAVLADDLDLPLLHYEVARIRARAYRDLGRATHSRWHASIAQTIAIDHGWAIRARWIRAEFTLEAMPGSTNSTVHAHRGSGQTDRGSIVANGIEQRRLQALQQIGLAAASVLDPVEVARLALDEIVTIFAAERAFLFVRKAGDGGADLQLDPFIGRGEDRTDLTELTGYGSTLVDRVAESGAPLVVAGSEEGAALGSQSTVIHGLRSIMVVPLQLKGRLHGVIYMDSRAAKGVFTPDDVDILVAITNHIATALETARAAKLESGIHAARRERDLAQLLHHAMTDLGGSLDPDEVSQRLIDTMSRALPIDAAVLLRRTDSETFTVVTTTGTATTATTATTVDPTTARWLNGHTDGSASGTHDEPTVQRLLGCRPGGWLVAPLVVRGEQRGLVVAGTISGSAYTEAEIEIATALVGQGAVALENAVLYRQVQSLATRDGLTGLFNRRHFIELAEQRLATTRRHPRPVAAVMIDIDHFKNVNDTYGHSVGDEVIRDTATRLAKVLRDSDIICRYGGEEFAILLPETTAAQASIVANQLCAAINATPLPTTTGPLPVTVSVGLTRPNAGNDVHTLLKIADEALYDAKRSGRNQVAVAQPG